MTQISLIASSQCFIIVNFHHHSLPSKWMKYYVVHLELYYVIKRECFFQPMRNFVSIFFFRFIASSVQLSFSLILFRQSSKISLLAASSSSSSPSSCCSRRSSSCSCSSYFFLRKVSILRSRRGEKVGEIPASFFSFFSYMFSQSCAQAKPT